MNLPKNKKETDEPEKESEKSAKFLELSDLKGIGDATVKKLETAGINTVEALAFATENKLEELGIKKEAASLIQEARKRLSLGDFITAADLMEQRKNVKMLTTGSKILDALFKGGYETQSVTEIAGEFACGKSQLCFSASVLVQQPFEQGGLEGGVLFVDSEDTFKAQRIVEIAKGRGLDPAPILEHIIYSPAFNSDHQIFILDHADKIIRDNNIKLIVVDSVMAHFRSEYIGREMLGERQGKLNQHLHQILRLARGFNAVALVTNQVTANPSGMPYAPQWFATGGNIMGHANALRIQIRKAGANKRVATICDSSWLPWGERPFLINEKGVDDLPPDEKLAKRYATPTTENSTPETAESSVPA